MDINANINDVLVVVKPINKAHEIFTRDNIDRLCSLAVKFDQEEIIARRVRIGLDFIAGIVEWMSEEFDRNNMPGFFTRAFIFEYICSKYGDF